MPWSGATQHCLVAYAGGYSFDGDRVVHHVELSLFPDWVGSDQERSVKLAGARLTLKKRVLGVGLRGHETDRPARRRNE
jgi:hypothetical protein